MLAPLPEPKKAAFEEEFQAEIVEDIRRTVLRLAEYIPDNPVRAMRLLEQYIDPMRELVAQVSGDVVRNSKRLRGNGLIVGGEGYAVGYDAPANVQGGGPIPEMTGMLNAQVEAQRIASLTSALRDARAMEDEALSAVLRTQLDALLGIDRVPRADEEAP